MHRLTSQLLIYKNIASDSILCVLAEICRRFKEGNYDREKLVADIYTEIHRLLDLSTSYGFNKNLWHNYLAFLLAMTENPFTLVSEKTGAHAGTVNEFARQDFMIFKNLFDYDFSAMEKELGISCFSLISNYQAIGKSEHIFNKSVSEKVQLLSMKIEKAHTPEELYDAVTGFYRDYGVGKLGMNKAFRLSHDERQELLIPITSTENVSLDDLVGYESQKARLVQNTEAFVTGRKANNLLLYGDAGTGKSTSIKAVLNKYYGDGLRMIELYKHEVQNLSKIIDEIKTRNYRFIIYMDDLSFEEFEVEYKYLKAVIEGGLEAKPDNVLIYATSNRRHLIRETWSDRSDISQDEVHRSDTMQEKLSLAARFGEAIGYYKPSQEEYLNIVITLARRHPEITLTDDELKAEAIKWEMNHSGVSGRTAQQFVTHLLSCTPEKK